MPGHQCYHCKQWVEHGEAHDCWTTTEAALTEDLSEELREAWERLRNTAAEFGDQRIYASHHCIMFSRKACYFFVRPKRSALEVVFFLGRPVTAPQVRRIEPSSKIKLAHFVHLRHRDEVEPPITDWLREAYESSDALSGPARRSAAKPGEAAARSAMAAKTRASAKPHVTPAAGAKKSTATTKRNRAGARSGRAAGRRRAARRQ